MCAVSPGPASPSNHSDFEQAEVAVAGGGIIGLSIAWRLAQANCKVAVFERGAFGKEASWAGAGMLAPGGELEEVCELTTRALGSRVLYRGFVRELERATSTAIDYQECGALDVAYSAAAWEALQTRARRQRELGIASKTLDAKQVATFWPRVRTEGLAGALFFPDDAIVNPREFTAALLQACRASGVELNADKAVDCIDIANQGVSLHAAEQMRRFDRIVVAAGAWSSSIPISGVPALPGVKPIKGHLIGYQQPEQTCNTIVRHGHRYLLQRANGMLIAGASVEDAGWDRSIDHDITQQLVHDANFVLPHLAETNPTEVWTGFRPASDKLQIGRWHSDALYLAYGHFRNGILLAPETAQDIARQITTSLETR